MLTRILHHFRGQYLGAIALFVALGGTTYAATSLPNGSVGTKQLRNGAVTNQKLGKGAVGAASLSAKSFGGYVGFYAAIASNAKVYRSSPQATAKLAGVPGQGRFLVTWKRPIPRSCFPLVSVTDAVEAAYASTFLVSGPHDTFSGAYVDTYEPTEATGSVPESFTLAFICP